MKEYLKKAGRIILQAIMWIFIFSIRIDGNTIFHYGHSFFVDNQIVASIDNEIGDLWYRVTRTAKITFHTITERKDRG